MLNKCIKILLIIINLCTKKSQNLSFSKQFEPSSYLHVYQNNCRLVSATSRGTPAFDADRNKAIRIKNHAIYFFLSNNTQLKPRMQEPVVRSETRTSIVYAVTSHVKFQSPKIEK